MNLKFSKSFGIFLSIIFFLGIALSGCKSTRSVTVLNTTVESLSYYIKDFAGLNGYRIVYSNELANRASYRVYLGSSTSIIPAEYQTVIEGQNFSYGNTGVSPNFNQNLSRTTVRTTDRPYEQVTRDYVLSVQLRQEGNHVSIFARGTGGHHARKVLKRFKKYLSRHQLITET